MKTFRSIKEGSLDDKLDKYVSNEIKKRKLARFPVNATDDYKMKKGKPAFTYPSPTGSMVIHVWLRKMSPSKGQPKGIKAFNYELDDIKEVAQDKDIKDREGTQPAKYYAGDMAKSTKTARARHFDKKKKGPAPGDASAKTKPSKHTLKFKQMYGEQIEGLKNKSKKSGISYGILKKVYDRGMAAYKTGHRPGTTAQQWAMARVNSFITKGKGTWGGADKDLASKVS